MFKKISTRRNKVMSHCFYLLNSLAIFFKITLCSFSTEISLIDIKSILGSEQNVLKNIKEINLILSMH